MLPSLTFKFHIDLKMYKDKIIYARIYRLLAFLAALLVVGSGFIRTITHFVYKVSVALAQYNLARC